MNKRALLSFLVAPALAFSVAGCGSSTDAKSGADGLTLIQPGTLTVCSDVPYPPFEDFDKSAPSGFKGFDIDVIQKIADDLKLKLQVKDSSFDALQSGQALNAGQCDLVASAMTITLDRKKHLSFSDGYYDSKQSLLVPADSGIAKIGDLNGKKVGVQQGTTGQTYARKNATGAQIVTFPSDAEMYAALKAGQVDALLQDFPVNLDHQNDPKQPGKYKVVEVYDTNEAYGFGIKKGNTSLVNAVNKELTAMHNNGSYDDIYNKYFSLS